MKQKAINKDIILLEYDYIKTEINYKDLPKNANYICGVCGVCKKPMIIHEGLCDECKDKLLKYEEYLIMKKYDEWFEAKIYPAGKEIYEVLKKIEKQYPELKYKNEDDIKAITIEYRDILENKTLYFVFTQKNLKDIKLEYNIKNIDVLIKL